MKRSKKYQIGGMSSNMVSVFPTVPQKNDPGKYRNVPIYHDKKQTEAILNFVHKNYPKEGGIDTTGYLAYKKLLEDNGNPDISLSDDSTRPHYNPFSNTLHLDKKYPDRNQIIAETSHAHQEKYDPTRTVLGSIYDWFNHPYFTRSGYNELYDIPGTVENEAHDVIQRNLYSDWLNNRQAVNYTKRQYGGGDTDFFNQLVDNYASQYQSQESDNQTPQYEDVPQTDEDNTDYQDLQERYDNLQSQFDELSGKINGLTNPNFQDDSFLNFLFSDSEDKKPIDFDEPSFQSYKGQKGLNPALEQENRDIFGRYDVTNLGAWGDQAHQQRQSDHNTGDAQDYGVNDPEVAQNVIAELQKNPKTKYIIYDKKIWNPSISEDWRPYNGSNPHTDHVHASFNRQYGGAPVATSEEDLYNGLNDPYYAQFGALDMNLPQQFNQIRGLDSGVPVRVQDELGQTDVLYGKNHKKYFFGKIKEQML